MDSTVFVFQFYPVNILMVTFLPKLDFQTIVDLIEVIILSFFFLFNLYVFFNIPRLPSIQPITTTNFSMAHVSLLPDLFFANNLLLIIVSNS